MWDSKHLKGMWLLGLAALVVWGCSAILSPFGLPAGDRQPVPPGHVRAMIHVQLPSPKTAAFATQATNDLRNQTLPAKMRLTVTGLDITTPVEPNGSYQNPIPLATVTATVSMIVPLGRNLIIKAEGLTLSGETIASAVVKGLFSATVDQGTVTAQANRLTTPVAEVMEAILAKQTLGPDEQRRSRNLMLGYDPDPLQQFIQATMLGGTGNLVTDLQALAGGTLPKHPGLVNTAAVAKYLWEKVAVPPNPNFLADEQGRGPFLTAGRVTGTISGVRAGVPVVILCDDPVSGPVTVLGGQPFTLPSVRPGAWRVHAFASGYRPSVVHFTGPGTAPSSYAAGEVPANGERPNQDFSFTPIPPVVETISPSRGTFSPNLTNPAYVTVHGHDFGDVQDGAVVLFNNGATVAANLVESWSDTRIRVAVPTLTSGTYAVRVDRPTVNPGEFVSGASTGTYAAGTWTRLFPSQLLTPTVGTPLTAGLWRVGVTRSDDLHVFARLLIGWDSVLRGHQPTQINLGSGGTPPGIAFADQNTATPPGASWAVHPDGRSLYVWSTGSAMQARAFGIDGTPMGAAYDLVPAAESPQSACGANGAAFDTQGVLHLAYLARLNGSMRPGYRQFRMDGLGLATSLGPVMQIDAAPSGGVQGSPGLSLGSNGHVGVNWLDSRSGVAEHYFRVIKPNGSFGMPEGKRAAVIKGFAVDSRGGVALSTYQASEQKLAQYNPDGTLAGDLVVGQWLTAFNGQVSVLTKQGICQLAYDADDHLIAATLGIVREAYSPVKTSRTLAVRGYVQSPTGFVADTQRPNNTYFSHATDAYYTEGTNATPSMMTVGPDGTVSLVFNYWKGISPPFLNQFHLIQYGWS